MSHVDPFALIRTAVEDSPSLEEEFFQEGIDGHAESIPDDTSPGLTVLTPFGSAAAESARAAHTTIPGSPDDVLPETEVKVEDPARTRRRNAARAGAVWGAVGALALAAAAVCVSPRREAPIVAAHATLPLVETSVVQATVTPTRDTVPDQELQPLAVVVPPPPPVLAKSPKARAGGKRKSGTAASRRAAAR